jgi:hypothetical protein
MNIASRIIKLEAKRQASRYDDLTDDELQLAIYENAVAVMAHPTADATEVDAAAVAAEEIRRDIVATAQRIRSPEYQAWIVREFGASHVCAVTGRSWPGTGERADLHKPHAMERRAQLRNSPIVQSILLEAGLATVN